MFVHQLQSLNNSWTKKHHGEALVCTNTEGQVNPGQPFTLTSMEMYGLQFTYNASWGHGKEMSVSMEKNTHTEGNQYLQAGRAKPGHYLIWNEIGSHIIILSTYFILFL